jgi:hypothetical protein
MTARFLVPETLDIISMLALAVKGKGTPCRDGDKEGPHRGEKEDRCDG